MRGNCTPAVWALLFVALIILFVVIPWAMQHPPPHQDHVFGRGDEHQK